MIVKITVNDKPMTCNLRIVLFVPMLSYNLLSISELALADLITVFEFNYCRVYQNGKCGVQGTLRYSQYYLIATN